MAAHFSSPPHAGERHDTPLPTLQRCLPRRVGCQAPAWRLTALAAVAAAILLWWHDLRLDFRSLVWPAGFVLLLVIFGAHYRRRRIDNFVCCTQALLQLTVFSSIYTVLMYSAAAGGRPLIDDTLMDLDAALGVHLPAIVRWAQAHPGWQRGLRLCYDTLLPQTALVIGVLGLGGNGRCLECFVQRFILSALLTVGIFLWFPAAGPFEGYGYPAAADQQRYLAHFEGLRSGALDTVTLARAEGLITFPSFHTTWALLMALALRRRRVLFVPAAILNGAVMVSTLTTGWHYAGDVLAGVLMAGVAIAGSALLQRRAAAAATPLSTADPI